MVDFIVHVFPVLVTQASSSACKISLHTEFLVFHTCGQVASVPKMRASSMYTSATCNDDVQTFLIVAEKVGKITIVGGGAETMFTV